MKNEPVRGWLGALITAVVLLVLPLPDWIVERFYSRGLFPYVQGFTTSLSNLVPLAVLDLLIFGGLILVVIRCVRIVRSGGIISGLWEGVRRVIRVAGIVTILFVCLWGFNYKRIPLDTALRQPAGVSPAIPQLQASIADANALAGRLRPTLNLGANDPSYEQVNVALRMPFNKALSVLGQAPLMTPGRPKYSLILTPFFTWAGVNGMIDPLALESIVHPDLLPFERPFVLAHEWAHLSGHADEAEASAIGWLACMEAGPEMAYSASLFLIVEAGSALPAPLWQDARAKLDEGVRADLTALAKRQEKERPAVRRTAFRAYDQYLRANSVDDGVASYSRALSLILASPFRDALANYRVVRLP